MISPRPNAAAVPPTRRRTWAGLVAVAAALLVGISGFFPWLVIADAESTLSVSGWGRVQGPGELDGANINDIFAALDAPITYRPAQFVSVVAIFAIICGLVMIAKISRISNGVMVFIGFYAVVWGIFRRFNLSETARVLVGDPADPVADLAAANESGVGIDAVASAGIGPWLVFGGGLVLLAVGLLAFLGWFGAPAESAGTNPDRNPFRPFQLKPAEPKNPEST